MVCLHVFAERRVQAGGSGTFCAERFVSSFHAIHVGGWTSQVREVALEIGHFADFLHLSQDALFGARHDELSLMRRDGAEGTAAEAAPVDVHRKLNHVVGGDAFPFVFRVRKSRVGKVVGMVNLFRGHGRERRIHHDEFVSDRLQDSSCLQSVAFNFNESKVLGKLRLAFQAVFVGVQEDVRVADAAFDVVFSFKRDGLRDGRSSQDFFEKCRIHRCLGFEHLCRHQVAEFENR